jgi:hypothetical protein
VAEPLSRLLFREYAGMSRKEGDLQRLALTVYLQPPVFSHKYPTSPCSIHLYDINDCMDTFRLELRNIPLIVPVEHLLEQMDGQIEQGQTYWTCRLHCSAFLYDSLRTLAKTIGCAFKVGRIDGFERYGVECPPVSQSLHELASLLEYYVAAKTLDEDHQSTEARTSQFPTLRRTKGRLRPLQMIRLGGEVKETRATNDPRL